MDSYKPSYSSVSLHISGRMQTEISPMLQNLFDSNSGRWCPEDNGRWLRSKKLLERLIHARFGSLNIDMNREVVMVKQHSYYNA